MSTGTMRALITGITGFVGRHLARHLEAQGGYEVRGLATHLEPDDRERPDFYSVDVEDRDALKETVADCDPDVILHLAGLSHVGESWKRPGDYLRVNFGGTRNLVHAADGRRVIFASSAEVYGNVDESQQPIREVQPLDPRSPYAMTKACAEEVALDHDAIVVRSFNTIGPGQARLFALPSFASQLAAIHRNEAEPVMRVGDLSPQRDFLHIDDAVRGYEAILRDGRQGEIYNLASGTATSIAEAVERLMAVSGVKAEVVRDPARVRPVDIPLLQGDTHRIQQLGWQPELDLERALRDLWHEALELTEAGSVSV
ncbi:MAG: GDP-mannose 4,6-dehydratase [Holophagales bacterium]|nr:GDP-mannose 4,6-dehydratase [Holophagales bacterium]